MPIRFCVLAAFGAQLVAGLLRAQVPIREAPRQPAIQPALGVAPGSPKVTGTPATATVTWTSAPGASGYRVDRWSEVNQDCCRASSPVLPATATTWIDSNYPLAGTYAFRVTAIHPTGAPGVAEVRWIRPTPQDPTGFSALQLPGAAIRLTWAPVPGVTRYLVGGPGTTNGVPVAGTTVTLAGVPSGPQNWTVMSVYEPGGVFTKGVQTSAVVRILPSHAPAWLTKHNGGAAPELFWASDQIYVCREAYLGTYREAGIWNGCGGNLGHVDHRFQEVRSDQMSGPDVQASYGNINDLGVGRFTSCLSKGARVMCVTSSHGAAPGTQGFGDPAAVISASAGWSVPIGYSAIISEPGGMRFLSFDGYDIRNYARWETSSTFDSEGPKPTPHSCLNCHGGSYNPITKVVMGATMLPIDPSNLAFAPGRRAQNEEAIRKLNVVVLKASPSPAVAAYIRGLYNGAPEQPGMTANDNYVPPGWAQQTGFYRSVIKPYCANCHMAATSSLDLSSFGSVQRNKALIYAAVCTQRSMPHAEVPFRRFWTHDTGPIYLPGYFATVLGYPGCG